VGVLRKYGFESCMKWGLENPRIYVCRKEGNDGKTKSSYSAEGKPTRRIRT
jgi:hypothetical protein